MQVLLLQGLLLLLQSCQQAQQLLLPQLWSFAC
jgi:hypothetical protein